MNSRFARLCAQSSPLATSLLRPSTLSRMPLRAKISPTAFTKQMSSEAAAPIRELPGDAPDDVLFNSVYGLRTIELNRPSKLNSLNESMARKIVPRLQEWSKSQIANVIVLKGAGRALCAGGDVAALAKQNATEEGQKKSAEFFALEYKLDHYIATYSKPYVAFMDGITMGGGVGLSVHAPLRIATERTVFAMPETSIGFFPDVGGSFFLSRLDGELGTYLALTSETLKGVQNLYAGIATHYLHSSSLADVEQRLAELQFKDYATIEERVKTIDTTLEEFSTGLPQEPMLLAGETRKLIDKCFRFNTLDEIVAALEKEDNDFARNALVKLRERSPTSLRVALRNLRDGRYWSIAETFQREYYQAAQFMKSPEFVEGVSAKLIRKEKGRPNWNPNTIEESDDTVVEPFVKIAEGAERLPLLQTDVDYKQYPFPSVGLPNEDVIRKVVSGGKKTRTDIYAECERMYNGKQGVKAKAHDIVDRCTVKDAEGYVKWAV